MQTRIGWIAVVIAALGVAFLLRAVGGSSSDASPTEVPGPIAGSAGPRGDEIGDRRVLVAASEPRAEDMSADAANEPAVVAGPVEQQPEPPRAARPKLEFDAKMLVTAGIDADVVADPGDNSA